MRTVLPQEIREKIVEEIAEKIAELLNTDSALLTIQPTESVVSNMARAAFFVAEAFEIGYTMSEE